MSDQIGGSYIAGPLGSALKTAIYPCDKGTNTPIGYHYFKGNNSGFVCCIYCGARPKK